MLLFNCSLNLIGPSESLGIIYNGPSVLVVILNEFGPLLSLFFLQLPKCFPLYWLEYVEGAAESLVDVEDSSIIIELPAIVRG